MGNTIKKPSVASSSSSSATKMDVESLVTEAITTNPVVIFSKTYCPYCYSAKRDIANAGKSVEGFTPPKIFELDTMGSEGMQIQSYLAQTTGRRTVPNVFIGGVSVGGGDDISGYANSGVLKQMLAQAPVRLASSQQQKQQQQDEIVDNKKEEQEEQAVQEEKDENEQEEQEEQQEEKTVEQFVDDEVQNSSVVIFSKTYCPYCTRAKQLIAELVDSTEGLSSDGVTVHELDEMDERGAQIQDYLQAKTGQRTVPNVFINTNHIGGCDDIMSLYQQGKLIELLQQAFSSSSHTTATKDDDDNTGNIKEIVFGAGCFWGVELAFQRVVGVISTEVGYSNGKMSPVTYDAVCTGMTGAAEVVRVRYDEHVVSLKQLLDVWNSRHDITSLNKQGNDIGTQYRSAIFYNDDSQKSVIDEWTKDTQQTTDGEIVSDIAKVDKYCPAEEYHQQYLEKKGQSSSKGETARIRCYG